MIKLGTPYKILDVRYFLQGGNVNLSLVNTTNSAQYGVITKGGTRFIHNFNYGSNGTVTTTGNNTFVGVSSGNLTMGSGATETHHASYNSALGVSALSSNTTGSYNSAVGMSALSSNTTGYFNSAVGVSALYSNTTGYQNSAVGVDAGRFITADAANETSNNSVYLGYNTKAYADGDTNEIVLGASTTGFGSNTAAYGNSSITKHIFQAGNVGYGTTEPTHALSIKGIINFRSPDQTKQGYLSVLDSGLLKLQDHNSDRITINTGTGDISLAPISGNVGYGTTAPTYSLSFGGNAARTIWLERHTTSDTAGSALTITAGGATASATNKAGGTLTLKPGVSTGTGESGVTVQGCVAGGSGTSDNSFSTILQVLGNKLGFNGVTPITRPVLATGASKTVDEVITVLQNLGLVSQS